MTVPREGRAVVELRGARFSYPDGQAALDGVDLTVREGERLCVLGGNGSGKSTLIQLMNALLVPTEGEARVFGMTGLEYRDALRIRERAAMVFQHPEDQMTASIVEEDVAFGPENLGLPAAQIADRVSLPLEAVGMAAYAKADPADLSGGQKLRVAIAGALAMDPDLLLLDEPGAMLDTEGRRAINGILSDLGARGITIVHVTHFMEDALLADRVVVMREGRVAFDGDPLELFSRRGLVRELDLELPAHLRLAEMLAEAGVELDEATDEAAVLDAVARAARTSPVEARDGANAAGTQAPSAIAFEGASFSYATARNARKRSRRLPGGKRDAAPGVPLALDRAAFTVPTGSVTALIGRTGSGKSTAVELACALKVPCAGTVRACGIDTGDLSRRRDLRRSVGYVSQLPERQLFAETVFDDVAFGPRNLGVEGSELSGRVSAALRAVGLEPTDHLLARSPFSLSGGQQRCVAIAGVLAMAQPVIILDEPMAGLDPRGRRNIKALLRRLNEQGATLLIVTHSMDDVAELADHVVALDGGRVVAEGTPRELFLSADRPDALAGLGLPAAPGLARGLARRGLALDPVPLTLDELAKEVVGHGASR